MEALRRAQESLTQDDIVEKTAKALSTHLESVAKLWIGQPGACDRLSKLLGIVIPKKEESQAVSERRETAAKVSALVLANAFIFQEQLALSDERVDTLRKLKKSSDLIEATSEHWRWIWENINYVPIFQLGERILDELPASASTTEIVKSLLDAAHKICAEQAALRHDLMGRIYHWLLHHAKYLGTYYTSVSAATLLLKVALDLKWSNDFGSARELADFKVADLACGTGTLLMAAAQCLTDGFIKTRAESDRSIGTKDLSVLHSTLMQNVIHGYDILSSAVHFTASTPALLAPEVRGPSTSRTNRSTGRSASRTASTAGARRKRQPRCSCGGCCRSTTSSSGRPLDGSQPRTRRCAGSTHSASRGRRCPTEGSAVNG